VNGLSPLLSVISVGCVLGCVVIEGMSGVDGGGGG